jgi:hypothetical protein
MTSFRDKRANKYKLISESTFLLEIILFVYYFYYFYYLSLSSATSMDRFLSPHSPEALAYVHMTCASHSQYPTSRFTHQLPPFFVLSVKIGRVGSLKTFQHSSLVQHRTKHSFGTSVAPTYSLSQEQDTNSKPSCSFPSSFFFFLLLCSIIIFCEQEEIRLRRDSQYHCKSPVNT